MLQPLTHVHEGGSIWVLSNFIKIYVHLANIYTVTFIIKIFNVSELLGKYLLHWAPDAPTTLSTLSKPWFLSNSWFQNQKHYLGKKISSFPSQPFQIEDGNADNAQSSSVAMILLLSSPRKLWCVRPSPRAKLVSGSDLVAGGTQSLSQDTEYSSCTPGSWCVSTGVGGRACKGPTASFLPSSPSPCCTPSDARWLIHSPWPIASSGSSPCSPRLPISSACSFKRRNAFLKRWVISHPFPNCLSYPQLMLHPASLIPFVLETSVTFVTEPNLF